MQEKIRISEEYMYKCHAIIHGASVAAGAAGAIPIPFADIIPISAIQIGMVIALGKVFGYQISKSAAKGIIAAGAGAAVGKTVFRNLVKVVPKAGMVAGAAIAASATEALGWLIADDFYRISIGKEPKNIIDAINIIGKFKIFKMGGKA